MASTITAPTGTSGLMVEPWSKGEIYAVAADWSQASSPVLVHGQDGWTQDSHGRQVASFRHNATEALESVIREAIEMSGDEPDDEEVASIVEGATELLSEDLGDLVNLLGRHGAKFDGGSPADAAEIAQDWLDHDFDADEAGAWCEIGVWDAGTAAEFRGADLTPEQVAAAAKELVAGLDDPAAEYTDGDPIYAACNGDISAQVIIDAAE